MKRNTEKGTVYLANKSLADYVWGKIELRQKKIIIFHHFFDLLPASGKQRAELFIS